MNFVKEPITVEGLKRLGFRTPDHIMWVYPGTMLAIEQSAAGFFFEGPLRYMDELPGMIERAKHNAEQSKLPAGMRNYKPIRQE